MGFYKNLYIDLRNLVDDFHFNKNYNDIVDILRSDIMNVVLNYSIKIIGVDTFNVFIEVTRDYMKEIKEQLDIRELYDIYSGENTLYSSICSIPMYFWSNLDIKYNNHIVEMDYLLEKLLGEIYD